MPKETFIPSVVIYIEEGEIKLVQADIEFTVYLVNYDIQSLEGAIVLEQSPNDCDPDYVEIDEIMAEVDAEAVRHIEDLYYNQYFNEDGSDAESSVIRKE